MLTLTNLTMQRGETRTLDLSALSIQPRQNILILGPSGCGKTTLLHILAGLLRPTSGDVAFEGKAYSAMTDQQLDRLRGHKFGFVFQQLHLLKHLSVRDNIRLAAPKADIPALLASLGLQNKEKKAASSLSVGEAQRVAIVRAIANKPAIIFADEPTSALDDVNAQTVLTLLREQAAATGAALVIATHDARIMDGFDSTLRLHNGKISQ